MTGKQHPTNSYFVQEQIMEKYPANTNLEHLAKLKCTETPHMVRKTGIICTIGPACRSIEMLEKMIENGMNIARMNFSHGDHEYHGGTIKNVREAAAKFNPPRMIAIALDTKGPEIRTGLLTGGGSAEISLEKGASIRLTTDAAFEKSGTAVNLYVDYKNITKVVSKGSHVFIDDGLLSLIVEEIYDDAILCTVENGGKLGSRKGVNLPGTPVDLPAVSDKDIKDLKFGVEQGVDIIFASFIRNAKGIRSIKEVLGEKGKSIKIVAKNREPRRGGQYGFFHSKFVEELLKNTPQPTGSSETIAIAATSAAVSCRASAIILLTTTGKSAQDCSRYKPTIPILAITRYEQVARQLHLYRGVFPLQYPSMDRNPDWTADMDNRILCGIELGKQRGFIHTGDFVVVITGWRTGAGSTNTIRLLTVQ
uniref:Pyruvate kinase n=1 Tax=Globodera pallida TaxID=36090 RepID=A0A183C2T6_GLOPA